VTHLRKMLEKSLRWCLARLRIQEFDPIAEATEVADHLPSAKLLRSSNRLHARCPARPPVRTVRLRHDKNQPTSHRQSCQRIPIVRVPICCDISMFGENLPEKQPAERRSHGGERRIDPPALTGSTYGTAVCGPACTVVWHGRVGNHSPYADWYLSDNPVWT